MASDSELDRNAILEK